MHERYPHIKAGLDDAYRLGAIDNALKEEGRRFAIILGY